jgi:hypothetical protein
MFSKNINSENEPKKRSKKIYLVVGFSILLLTAVFAIYRYSQKSAQGEIKPAGSSQEMAEKANEVPEAFPGMYLTFLYPSNFTLKSHDVSQNPDDIFLERAYLSENTATSKKISLTIRKLVTNNLDDVPDYKMRFDNPEKYKMEKFEDGKIEGLDFVPTGETQFEKTYFLQNGSLLAILTFITPAISDETLNKEADTIARSISWLK